MSLSCYFIAVASNDDGEEVSNCLKVTVQKSGAPPGIPGYNLLFLIAFLGAITSLLIKKKLNTNLQ